MDLITAKSGRQYTPLPIDAAKGFPQSFPFAFEGRAYNFRLYVNTATEELDGQPDFLDPFPGERAYLVAQVERATPEGSSQLLFARKVLPGLEYEFEEIALVFPFQRIARNNLNGQGAFGSQVIGGIARRWA
jgi:hypothetical protein